MVAVASHFYLFMYLFFYSLQYFTFALLLFFFFNFAMRVIMFGQHAPGLSRLDERLMIGRSPKGADLFNQLPISKFRVYLTDILNFSARAW